MRYKFASPSRRTNQTSWRRKPCRCGVSRSAKGVRHRFDKVPHQRLIAKLQAHGITGKALAWIKAWLLSKRQRVTTQGALYMSQVPWYRDQSLGPFASSYTTKGTYCRPSSLKWKWNIQIINHEFPYWCFHLLYCI